MEFPSPHAKELPDQIKCTRPPESDNKTVICDRIVGSLVGLGIGDALGASVEFRPQTYLAANPVDSMKGGGTWGLDAGKWTDDTSMALCLAASLINEDSFNPYDQMVRYKWWHKYGYLSSTGSCFDIGQATRQSIDKFSARQKLLKTHYRCRNDDEVDKLTWDSVERIGAFDVVCGDEGAAGNGALMRLAPVPLFFFKTPMIAIAYAGYSARLTHGSQKAIDACRYYAALIVAAVNGESRENLLSNQFYETHQMWFGEFLLHQDILSIAHGSFKKDKGYEDGIRGKGYIVNALEAALWAFWSDGGSFEKGALAAVNLGDDTDTTAAIYGQLAGAHYGYKNIPKPWLDKLYAHQLIICMGQWLHFQGNQRSSSQPDEQNASATAVTTGPSKSPSAHKAVSASSTSHSEYSKVQQKNNDNGKPYFTQGSERHETTPINNYDRSISLNSTTNLRENDVASARNIDVQLDDFNRFTEQNLPTFYRNGLEDRPFYPNKSGND